MGNGVNSNSGFSVPEGKKVVEGKIQKRGRVEKVKRDANRKDKKGKLGKSVQG